MSKQYNTIYIKLCILFSFALGCLNSFAFNDIKGTVRDQSGHPISGVIIQVDGENLAETDNDGRFQLYDPKSQTFCFIHDQFKTLVADVVQDTVDVKLYPKNFHEKVFTGYNYQEHDSYIGAVSSVKGQELPKVPEQTLSNVLAGTIAGLTVMQTSGDPLENTPSMYIRGQNTYNNNADILVLVDGFESSMDHLMSEEIESVSILKDAAALAIYGIRGANGVILVNTKRGTEGKTKISVNTMNGFTSPVSMPQFTDAYTYARLYNEALSNDNGEWSPKYSDDELTAYKSGNDPYFYPNINWYDETLRDYVPFSHSNISFSGGNVRAKYYLNFGYRNTDLMYQNNEESNFDDLKDLGKLERYNFRSNLDVEINDIFSVELNLSGAITESVSPSKGNFFSLIAQTPNNAFPVKNEDGTWAASSVYTQNPLGTLYETGKQSNHDRILQTTLRLNQNLEKLLKGLKLFEAVSYSSWSRNNYDISKDYERWNIPKTNGVVGDPIQVAGTDSEFSISENERYQWTRKALQLGLEYDKQVDNHFISVLFGSMYSNYVVDGNNLPYKNAGLFGKLGYNYDHRFFGEFNFAYNGSENLPPNNKYGFFPSVSAAWLISNENFLKENEKISYLRLRVSTGMLGSGDLGSTRFGYQTYYVPSDYTYQLGASGNVSLSGRNEGRLGNPNITYDKNYRHNIGVDFEYVNKLSVSLDAFYEQRKGLLVVNDAQTPSVYGAILPYENLGWVNNAGGELTINYHNQIGELAYNIGANFSFARSNIKYQAEVVRQNSEAYRTGNPVGTIFGLEAIGLFNSWDEINDPETPLQMFGPVQPGDIRYKDLDGNGYIDENDEKAIGYSNVPEINYGINLGLNYKGFDLQVNLFGQGNRSVILPSTYSWAFYNDGQAPKMAIDRWAYYPDQGIDTRTTANYPRLTTSYNQNNYRSSTLWLRDCSFLRLRNLEFGYDFQNLMSGKVKVSQFRLFVSGSNLFTLSSLEEFDPQILGGCPLLKSFSIGLNVEL